MILSECYHELPDDLSDDDLDDAIDEAVAAARLIADDPFIKLDDFLRHLERIYPVWCRDPGSFNELLSISQIDAECVMKIHEECCNISQSVHDDCVPEHWTLSSEAV